MVQRRKGKGAAHRRVWLYLKNGYRILIGLRVSGTCCIYEVERKRKRVFFANATPLARILRSLALSQKTKGNWAETSFPPGSGNEKNLCTNPFRLHRGDGCPGTNFNDNSRGADVATFGIMCKRAGGGKEPLAIAKEESTGCGHP